MAQNYSHTAQAHSRREAAVFANRAGLNLFGILHTPEAGAEDRRRGGLGVILLSPGVKMRVGPERLYLRMTDALVTLGCPVLRFDFYGLGDSEGTLQEPLLKDVYNHIEVGRYIDDVVDAMDWMQKRCGVSRFIVSGLCGGAITGLLAGSRDSRIAGLVALSITPLLASRSADPASYMTSAQLTDMRRRYINKLTTPKAWLRLLTFESDYKVIWRAATAPLRARAKQAASAVSAAPAAPPDDNASPLFPRAFFEMAMSNRPMLFLFGESDRLYWEFDEKFVARHREQLATVQSRYRVHVIKQANHVYSFDEWQRELVAVTTEWLEQHFPQDVALPLAAASR